MRLLQVASGVLAVSFAAFAQTDRGTITGTVTDPAGAVIPNAMVQAKNEATGVVYQAASSSTGNYTVPQLPVGTYDLTVSAPGFKQYVRPGLVVEVAGILRIDALMAVGTATETVEVTGGAPLLKTESSEVSYNVPTSTLNDLPILDLAGAQSTFSAGYFGNEGGGLGNIRNPLSMVNLLPGTNFQTDNVLMINGLPSSSQSINIEGQDANNGFMGQLTQMVQPSTDAIQEVAIQTSNFAAEYGQAGGGYINYTMKSGTNQLHGSGYDYFANEALNAGLPFTDAGSIDPAKAGEHVRNPIRQNDFGFTVGGPIVIPKIYNGHDKTFFFFNFEQFWQSNFTTNTVNSVPTPAMRQGDFSGALIPGFPCGGPDPIGQMVCLNEIFDPATYRLVNGSPVASPFPNNVIPVSRMDPTALAIQNMFPLPNTPSVSGLNNYTSPGYADFRHKTIPSLKIDENINSKMKLSGYYSATRTESPQTNGFTQVWTSVVPQNILAQTARLNFDYTLTPTLLLHFGAGLMHTSFPQQTPAYNQATNNLFPDGAPFPANYFPFISGLASFLSGGFSPSIGNNFYEIPSQYDIKSIFNASTTWVHGNHTFKFGANAIFDGLPTVGDSGAQGLLGFAQTETADPWQNGQPFAAYASSGFGYASFLLGAIDSIGTTSQADARIGRHNYSLYLQDSWKVTRKLTLELGLRWDYENLWTEEHGRMQSAGWGLPDETMGGRLGAVEYMATCKCQFSNAYPFSIGPHMGVAYQITPKTVFRAGGAISYGAGSDNAELNGIFQDQIGVNAPGYGIPAGLLKYGDPYGVGNVYGNPVVNWPNTFLQTDYFPPPTTSGLVIPSSPFVSIANNAGRLPRIFQWSVGLQREITSNIVVEAAYVGNRGAWWVAPELAGYPNYNSLTPQGLLSQWGLNVANPNDAALLNDPLNSPAVQARFPTAFPISTLANGTQVVNSVYPGFPATEPLNFALRPWPQWAGVPPFLGPPMGRTWYDSLQAKVTKRLSHGLMVQAAYTWEKDQTLGTDGQTSYITPANAIVNDVFNLQQNKQLATFDLPQTLTISFSYVTPKLPSANTGFTKALSWLARGWTYTGVLRYQNGFLLPSPPSNNQLLADLDRGPNNNPALFGGGATLWNRVPGQPLFLVNPNSHFDPTNQLVLNPNAWTDAATGQFGTSAAYYDDFRWQRQPSESMGFGRLFRFGQEGRFALQVRAEFQNIFNRMFYAMPSDGGIFATNPASATARGNSYDNINNLLSAGFGYVNWFQGGVGSPGGPQPRSGKIVARFTF